VAVLTGGHDARTTCGGDGVEGDRVVGGVRGETGHGTSDPSIRSMPVRASSLVASVKARAIM
jgi:hypothetical protein